MSTHKWETIRHKSKAEGVAAPLEPLNIETFKLEPLMPPETIWLQIGEDEPGVENKSFSEFRDEVTWCWHKINDNDLEYRLVAEGVAAPLEPSRKEFSLQLHIDWLAQDEISDFRNWLIEKLWAKEKEIAALRETK